MQFFDYSLSALEQTLINQDVPKIHAKRLFTAVYKENCLHPFQQPEFPKKALSLEKKLPVITLNVTTHTTSTEDGSIKFLMKLKDNKEVETVLIRESRRLTLCLSSQVGCQQKCIFCETAKMNLSRNLEVSEIISQIVTVKHWLKNNQDYTTQLNLNTNNPITNIVFMGMGEPLDNVENIITAISIMQEPCGLNIAPKRLTVSTAGHLSGLKKLINSNLKFSLALSLHATTNSLRSKLMPINKRFPIHEVFNTLKAFTQKTQKEIFIQYTLFKGINDSVKDANSLAQMLKELPVKVNLIPFNKTKNSALTSPEKNTSLSFQKALISQNIYTTIRFSKGQDILAACGQLSTKGKG